MVSIYALIDPITEEVRYIGKSWNPLKRLKEHIKDCNTEKTRKAFWIRSLRRRSLFPGLIVLCEVEERDWQSAEQYCILLFASVGCSLVNGDGGGLGSGRHTPELRAKISKALKGKRYPKQHKPCLQYSLSGELVGFHISITDAEKIYWGLPHKHSQIAFGTQ